MTSTWDEICRMWYDEVTDLRDDVGFDDERVRVVHSTGTLHDPELHQAIADRGWIGLAWSPTSTFADDPMRAAHACALWEAFNYHMLPVDFLELTEMAAYTVAQWDPNPAQRMFLQRVCDGSALASLGFSEPDAGSDLASAQTSAVRDGDEWIINGSKIFTTGAHVADLVLLFCRTNQTERRYDRFTTFLVPLGASGIDIQPIRTLGGERTNATFYNDVRVSHDDVVGDVGRGWSVVMSGLGFERSMMGSYLGRAQRVLDDCVKSLTPAQLASSDVISRLAEANARIEAARACVADVARRIADGLPLTSEAATTKLLSTEVFKDLTYVALDIVGPEALTEAGDSLLADEGRLEQWFRGSQVATIYGGSNEIQRNIIARHRLDLPTA